MALDVQGRPIPVFVPPSPQPPDPTSLDHVSSNPDITNDVSMLKDVVADLNIRFAAVERFASQVDQLVSRVVALEPLSAQLADVTTKTRVTELALEAIPQLADRVAKLEILAAQIEVMNSRMDALEAQIFKAWEEGRVNPVPPA